MHVVTMVLVAGMIAACGSLKGIALAATDEPPGVGAEAEMGYTFSTPILAALEQYRFDKQGYPAALTELVPDYLPEKPAAPEGLDYSYASTGNGYAFSFHYIGPGMNTCTIKPGEAWRCSGAY